MTMNKSAKQPFKELPIVRLRPEQRADEHPRYPRYWRRTPRRIVELPYPDSDSPRMWEDRVAGWRVETNLLFITSDGSDDPKFQTMWFGLGGGGVGAWHSAVSTDQASAYAKHCETIQEIADEHARLQAEQQHTHVFELKPTMEEWMQDHTPTAQIKGFGVFGQRVVISAPNEAFEFKMRWGGRA